MHPKFPKMSLIQNEVKDYICLRKVSRCPPAQPVSRCHVISSYCFTTNHEINKNRNMTYMYFIKKNNKQILNFLKNKQKNYTF